MLMKELNSHFPLVVSLVRMNDIKVTREKKYESNQA